MMTNDSIKVKNLPFSYKVNRVPYIKLLLHAARYSFAQVNGLLIGTIQNNQDGKHHVLINDAIPLFHTPVLSPMLETAFALVEEYCASDQTPEGTCIVGWYHGSARANFDGIPKHVTRIISKMNSRCTDSYTCLVMIEANQLADAAKHGVSVLVPKGNDASTWTDSAIVDFDDSASTEFEELLNEGRQNELQDVDSWLEDTKTHDWRNLELVK